jgi:hypothetical protein
VNIDKIEYAYRVENKDKETYLTLSVDDGEYLRHLGAFRAVSDEARGVRYIGEFGKERFFYGSKEGSSVLSQRNVLVGLAQEFSIEDFLKILEEMNKGGIDASRS